MWTMSAGLWLAAASAPLHLICSVVSPPRLSHSPPFRPFRERGAVLVSGGCRNKSPQANWLKQQTFILFQLRSLTSLLPPAGLGGKYAMLSRSSWEQSLVLLALKTHRSDLCLRLECLSSLRLCVNFSAFLSPVWMVPLD